MELIVKREESPMAALESRDSNFEPQQDLELHLIQKIEHHAHRI